jgi:hypothetical protein
LNIYLKTYNSFLTTYCSRKNWHNSSLKKVQLTLSQSKKKKGDEVVDDEDDDAMRTSVSQDRVTATLCIEELFLSTLYIYSSPRISERSTMRGEDTDSQHDTFRSPNWVNTSQLDLNIV